MRVYLTDLFLMSADECWTDLKKPKKTITRPAQHSKTGNRSHNVLKIESHRLAIKYLMETYVPAVTRLS